MIFSVAGDRIEVTPEIAIVAGFTGRDRRSVEAHIRELRDHGVPTPDRVPSFYEVSPHMLTQADSIAVAGTATSGEAEIAIIRWGDHRLVTLASDHTDREAESVDIELSKRVCPKPFAHTAWEYNAVARHWDDLELTSWIDEGGHRTLYQSGLAGEFLPLGEIESAIRFRRRPSCWVLLMGTLPAVGGIRSSTRFTAQLRDPDSGRSIDLAYDISAADHLTRD